MRRFTLDLIFSGMGAVMAVALVVLGLILASEATFARESVAEQLGAQRITFTAQEYLSEEEMTWQEGSTCLVENAGQQMLTGGQARCYADYYIGMHMRRAAAGAGYGWDTETYATMGGIQRALRGDLAAATEAGDAVLAETVQVELDAAGSLRSTFQSGETLRGMLLTTYGFSIFGDRAAQASTALYAGAAALALLSVAGAVHAFSVSGSTVGRREQGGAATAGGTA